MSSRRRTNWVAIGQQQKKITTDAEWLGRL
jgi:hypothetical protein